jgi:hypothetical protein
MTVVPARGTPRRQRRGDPVAGTHIPETVVMGPRFRGDDSVDAGIAKRDKERSSLFVDAA